MRRGIPFVVSLLLTGAIAGVLIFGLVRLAVLPSPAQVHYHANWAIVVEGQRLDLSDERYMEDVVRCKVDPTLIEPEDRVHLHDGNADVVHVHHGGATWGHLLANLGFAVAHDHLFTDSGDRFVSDGGRTLKFILNGLEVPSIANLPIGDRDRLLISYGPETAEEAATVQFPEVAASAAEYNTRPDPAGCAGAQEETIGERLRRAYWR